MQKILMKNRNQIHWIFKNKITKSIKKLKNRNKIFFLALYKKNRDKKFSRKLIINEGEI